MNLIRKTSVAYSLMLALAFTSATTSFVSAQEKSNPDRKAIINAVASYVDAFNNRDASKVAQHWAQNGEMVNAEGDVVVGRENIEKAMEKQFQDMASDNTLSVTVQRVTFVTKDVAIEVGIADVAGDQTEYTAVHKKEGRSWKLHSIRETAVSLPGPAAGKLAELEWMVGEWVDDSDDAVVRTSCRWSKNNHFLINNFKVEVPDAEPMNGTQVIAYDAAKDKIRSWTFDSQGRIAEGTWSNKNGKWIVRSKSVTKDGLAASSTNVITVKDENEYSWKSTKRKVDGEELPDIGPVNAVRLKEEASN